MRVAFGDKNGEQNTDKGGDTSENAITRRRRSDSPLFGDENTNYPKIAFVGSHLCCETPATNNYLKNL